jgi:hypothetical protein
VVSGRAPDPVAAARTGRGALICVPAPGIGASEPTLQIREGFQSWPFPDAVETVSGDLAHPGSLCSAMAGADRVLLLFGPPENEVQTVR